MGTLNRKIARRYGKAIELNNFKADGSLETGAPSIYDSADLLPTSGVAVGTQAYVTANQKLYIRATGGWYNVATVNTTPTINSVTDAGGDVSPFTLAKDGSTTTVITINATDSEGFPLTFSAVANSGFNGLATVAQDSSVFTITPKSEAAATTTEGTLTFRASDGVNVASEIATFSLIFKTENSRFTAALIKATGNNGTNGTFTDNSSNSPANNTAHTITRYGNPSNQAFTPHHPGGYSTYFDGTGDYLAFAETADDAFTFGTGDLTVEAWVYPTSAPGVYQTLISTAEPNDFQGIWFGISDTNYLHVLGGNGSSWTMGALTGGYIPAEQWTHVAYVRSGNTHTSYVNGVQADTETNSVSYGNTNNAIVIGGRQDTGSNVQYFPGFMSDVRVVKGTAVYTTNFTPPTSRLTAISNTKLLACHLPYFADGSSIKHSITVYGNTYTERFGPYDYLTYSASSHGTSVYFDGTGDYLTVPTSADFNYGSGDYTIEFWHYPETIETQSVIDQRSQDSPGQAVPLIWLRNDGYYYLYINGASVMNTGNNSVKANQWHHVVLQKSSNSTKFFINGVHKGTAYTDNLTYVAGGTLYIGKRWTAGPFALDGHIADFRIVKGTAVYNHSGFTPPTAPLTAIANTKLLTCNDAPDVYNTAGRSSVILSGDAKSSTTQTKNASASMYFDGTGDRVDFDDLRVGTGDFEIECWWRQTVAQSNDYRCVFGASPYTSTTPFAIFTWGNLLRAYIQGNSWIEFSPFSINTWYHLALKRENGLWTFFVNGTSQGTSTLHATYDFGSTVDWSIMAHPTSTSYNNAGYVEDFRITTDLIRYPFVSTKETLTAVSGTSFLTAHAATITDGSSNSLSITSQGDPTVSNFAPASSMKSIHFDGNDYLQIADGTYKTFGSDNWTIEAWVYPTEVGTGFGNYIWGDTASSGATNTSSTAALYNSSGKFGAYITVGTNTILTLTASNLTTPVNKWYKIALVREGNTFTLFVDGTVGATVTNSNGVIDSGQILTVGRTGAYNGLNFVGYISNYRIVKGTALYTNSFTAPTAELEA